MLGSNSMNWKWELDNNTFDLVNVSQFKNHHFSTIMALLLAIGQLGLTLVLYALDCYTCVRLLAYNSWASAIQPSIPFSISRWIFSGCILLSIVLLIYEFIYGIKVYFTKNISLTYTNSVARTLWSIKGYSYFCLYDQITPKGFFDYCAFFVYFSLKGCVKLLLADSPRQVINGLTIYSVVKNNKDLVVSSFQRLTKDGVKETWAIVFTVMGLSFVIWLFFIIQFLIAVIASTCVITKINQEGFNLKQFVCIRINEKVRELSSKYHKESLKQLKEENSRLGLKPTLPTLPDNINNDGYLYNNRNTMGKLMAGRRSLRKSGNDLLPLNRTTSTTRVTNQIQITSKPSTGTMRLPAQEVMSPIYNNVAFSPPVRQMTGNITSNSTGSDYGNRNNSRTDFNTSSDNLLSNNNDIQPRRDMPKPYPLNANNTRFTRSGSPLNQQQGFRPQVTGTSSHYSPQNPYTRTFTPNSESSSRFNGSPPNPFTPGTFNRPGSSGSESSPYSNQYMNRSMTGRSEASGQTNSASYTPLQPNHTAAGFGNANLPYPNTTGGSMGPFSPPTVANPNMAGNRSLHSNVTGGTVSSHSAPYNIASATGGPNLGSIHQQQTGSTFRSNYNSNLPYPNVGPSLPTNFGPSLPPLPTNGPRAGTNLAPPSNNKDGLVSPNSRLLLINNLYGGEADNGDSGVSPVLQTYKDMGLEDYMVKNR